MDVSIRAPVMGAMTASSRLTTWTFCFNPRPRDGGDVLVIQGLRTAGKSFNPRPRDGGD